MVFSSYGNPSSCYLPLDSDQGVTFYKNENSLFSPQPPTSVVCRRNPDNSGGVAMQPFGNNSHGTVVVDAVRQDFQPVAHLSSNGYYGYVPPSNMTPPASVTAAGTVSVQLDCQTATEDADAAMDCGGEMENFHQLQHQKQRKRKEYGEEATADCKRRKTWLEEEQRQQQQQAAGFGWNALPYAPQQHQMDCHEDAPMQAGPQCGAQTIIAATNNNGCFQVQLTPVLPVAMVHPIPVQQQPPKNAALLVESASKGRFALGNRNDRRWNIAMPTARSPPAACFTGSGHQQQSAINGGGQELQDLFVSLHGSGFFLAG